MLTKQIADLNIYADLTEQEQITMEHRTSDFALHMRVLRWAVESGMGFVATESNGVYYIEFTGGY